LQQGTHTTLDGQLGGQATEVMNISVYVDNLLDHCQHTFDYVSGNSDLAQINIGRTIGINTRIDFL